MDLAPAAIQTLLDTCLVKEGETLKTPTIVEGITRKFGFHPGRVANHADEIADLLAQLPEQFQHNHGGGWSFLNACHNRNGEMWTSEHRVMEDLFVLGIAAGRARWLLPREAWSSLPGGVPYVVVAPQAAPAARHHPEFRYA